MKSRDRNRGRPRARTASAAGTTATAGEPPPTRSTGDPIDRWFVPLAVAILVVAAALRLPELALNPFHHDEGVNGFFMTNLVRDGTYVYDPANYHGPSLYYFALASEILFGLTTEAMRLVPVLFGLGLVALTLTLRRYLGPVAVLVAGALLAVSPGAVYFSRYFIHETLVVALSMALVVATTFYLDRREVRFLVAAAAAAALLFATKETGIITVVVLLIATAIAHAYAPWRRPQAVERPVGRGRPGTKAGSVWIDGVSISLPGSPWRGVVAGRSAAHLDPGRHLAGAALVFLVIYVLLYSSFFTNFPKG
jgi:uncharacterized protein (TIGR03663 family)